MKKGDIVYAYWHNGVDACLLDYYDEDIDLWYGTAMRDGWAWDFPPDNIAYTFAHVIDVLCDEL